MGGCCCCCSSKRAELNSPTGYYYYPRALEERVPLSSPHVAPSAVSSGLLVDTNLDTSIPDAYRPPPVPMPFDATPGPPQARTTAQEISGDKRDASVQTTISDCLQESADGNDLDTSQKCEDLKQSNKGEINYDIESLNEEEIELSKSAIPVSAVEEEDACPICLDDYDVENPKLTTTCEHHFHLACILEWMERSDSCPVCDKELIFDPPID
ncbi:E3 ubiquitin-protein ligase [Tripterygium wilfordii]|uniref:RING-type E3 ubiquitin transferase n=1 Tax=Tripterygium wilfordii TaxID=458696 RepID=A0A7J7C9V3_TRIWF|nr:probable E3 ubiquitin-protein ligase RHB1A [Tripterygium wilfordii]KAF5730647.1 E3 ubiquitin-protein ligase [Tripterygium wilfordii]